MIIDDDVPLPINLYVSEELFTGKNSRRDERVKAIAYTICAIQSDGAGSDAQDELIRLQDIEYKMAVCVQLFFASPCSATAAHSGSNLDSLPVQGMMKSCQACCLKSAFCAHGAISLWDRDYLNEVRDSRVMRPATLSVLVRVRRPGHPLHSA
jgi:hypothetical protein